MVVCTCYLTLGCTSFVSNPLPSGITIKNSEAVEVRECEHICRDFRLREDGVDGESSQRFAVDVELKTPRRSRMTEKVCWF